MTHSISLAVLGGDDRQISMAYSLSARGYRVSVWGLGACRDRIGSATLAPTWQAAIEDADALILPLPVSVDGLRLHCPLQSDPDLMLRITTLFDAARGKLLLGGRMSESIRSLADGKELSRVDYFDSESLQLKNALPTVEGALEIALRELPVTLGGASVGILGFGRIGQLLGRTLQALGAQVRIYARRREQRTLAVLQHHEAAALSCRDGIMQPETPLSDLRVIFNTVPSWILTRELLGTLAKNTLLIDLASPPGGIDHTAARELGLRSIWATALPGKCAPESAGEILADTIHDILTDHHFFIGKEGKTL